MVGGCGWPWDKDAPRRFDSPTCQDSLIKNKRGKIVSKAKSALGKKALSTLS